jgi:hypothetical protein
MGVAALQVMAPSVLVLIYTFQRPHFPIVLELVQV